MAEFKTILKTCSRCKSSGIRKTYFEKNKKDNWYATCNKCRLKKTETCVMYI